MAHLPSCLRDLGGQRITHVARVLYEHGGTIEPDDGPLEIGTYGHVVLLEGAGDGESLRVQEGVWDDPFNEPLSEENERYVEEHGKWKRVDCSRREGYSDLVGQHITGVSLLANEHGRISGVRLSVETRSIWFVVEGDECHVHRAHPIGFTEVKG